MDALFRSGPYSTFHTYILGIPMLTSKRTPWYLRLVWLCLHGIQFPTDPMKDQFSSILCVKHLNRCKTSNFSSSRGAVHDWQSLSNEDTVSSWWYGVWSTPRTCYHFRLLHGTWLTQEPPCRLQQFAFLFSTCHFSTNVMHFGHFDRWASVHFRTQRCFLIQFWPGVLFCFAWMIHSMSPIR